jgi:hypothetical protein
MADPVIKASKDIFEEDPVDPLFSEAEILQADASSAACGCTCASDVCCINSRIVAITPSSDLVSPDT